MKIVITGACGFIGVHTAAGLLSKGHEVVAFDNLSRPGTKQNLEWLEKQPGRLQFVKGDLRRKDEVDNLIASNRDAGVVIHLAAQVAVTTSVADPRFDFEVNAFGTMNLLEAVRANCPEAIFLFSSTNKVYGEMSAFGIAEAGGRYAYRDLPQGVSENSPLDFHSPYGCSKGSADQYVRDYSRIYGLRSVVFRQSCIYGTRQFGLEDQGWVAWFSICAALGRKVKIYGDGRQVRDVLWIDDLVELYLRAIERIEQVRGSVYNIGGGADFTLSLLELIKLLEKETGRKLDYEHHDWRPGDQKVFISDISKAMKELDWRPRCSPEDGVKQLFAWTLNAKDLLEEVLAPVLQRS